MLHSGCWLWCAAKSKDQSPEVFEWELAELETIQTAEAAQGGWAGTKKQSSERSEDQQRGETTLVINKKE